MLDTKSEILGRDVTGEPLRAGDLVTTGKVMSLPAAAGLVLDYDETDDPYLAWPWLVFMLDDAYRFKSSELTKVVTSS